MYDKEALYTFLAVARDQVMAELENNSDYQETNNNIDQVYESLENSISKTDLDKLMTYEEEMVSKSSVAEEAMYLKGFQDGFNLVLVMTKGDIVKKYNQLTGKELHLSETC